GADVDVPGFAGPPVVVAVAALAEPLVGGGQPCAGQAARALGAALRCGALRGGRSRGGPPEGGTARGGGPSRAHARCGRQPYQLAVVGGARRARPDRPVDLVGEGGARVPGEG